MRSQWPRLLVGLILVYALFQGVAGALSSNRGEAGLLVGALVVLATLAVERLLFGMTPVEALRALGLAGLPRTRGLWSALAVAALLLLVFPAYTAVAGTAFRLDPTWPVLGLGLFAQAGIAEETLFRGYLFRRVRVGKGFRRAVALAAIPFVAVHLVLFFTLPWPIALASVALAAVMSLPLAYLFELGGGSVWPPAIVHFVAQGAIKLVVPVGGESGSLPLVWIAACAVIPLFVLLVPRATGTVQDFGPLLHEAIDEARKAGFGASASMLESRAFAAFTTSTEMLGEQGLAIREFLATEPVPPSISRKLETCLQEIRKAWPDA